MQEAMPGQTEHTSRIKSTKFCTFRFEYCKKVVKRLIQRLTVIEWTYNIMLPRKRLSFIVKLWMSRLPLFSLQYSIQWLPMTPSAYLIGRHLENGKAPIYLYTVYILNICWRWCCYLTVGKLTRCKQTQMYIDEWKNNSGSICLFEWRTAYTWSFNHVNQDIKLAYWNEQPTQRVSLAPSMDLNWAHLKPSHRNNGHSYFFL